MSTRNATRRRDGNGVAAKESHLREKDHHLTDSFLPHTPPETPTPERSVSPPTHWSPVVSPWLAWAIDPIAALKVLAVPVVLHVNYELVTKYVKPIPYPNVFGPIFLLSGYVEELGSEDPRYRKTWFDLAFLAYYVVFFSLVRQCIVINLGHPLAKYFGLRKEGKIVRFGEQFYALIYFAIFGAWGWRVMGTLPTWWYKTEYFWIDYPHWALRGEMKRYYLMQSSYWLQQFIVLLLGLEKPRKDYWELVAHHFVTLWLVGWSYFTNLTYIGNAVYMSMDIPDAFFAASKLLNYMQWNRAKLVSFGIFMAIWTYFRHYLNIKILYSVLWESPLVPEHTKTWSLEQGVYIAPFLAPAVFVSLGGLQCLNLFWYTLIWKVLIRAIFTREADDDRSEDEDDEPTKSD